MQAWRTSFFFRFPSFLFFSEQNGYVLTPSPYLTITFVFSENKNKKEETKEKKKKNPPLQTQDAHLTEGHTPCRALVQGGGGGDTVSAWQQDGDVFSLCVRSVNHCSLLCVCLSLEGCIYHVEKALLKMGYFPGDGGRKFPFGHKFHVRLSILCVDQCGYFQRLPNRNKIAYTQYF